MKANCDCEFGLLYVKPIPSNAFSLPFHLSGYIKYTFDGWTDWCWARNMIEKSYIICIPGALIRVSYIGWSCIASYGVHDKIGMFV